MLPAAPPSRAGGCSSVLIPGVLAATYSLLSDGRLVRQFSFQKACKMFLLIYNGKETHLSRYASS